MKLSKLLYGLDYKLCGISPSCEIEYIYTDSRRCAKNSVFVCIKGKKRNGENYIKEAVKNGAVCIVSETEHKGYPSVLVKNAREAVAFMWNNYYNSPSDNMTLIGITGTNGKTSTAFYIDGILKAAGFCTGLISTEICRGPKGEIKIPGGETADISAVMTTPDPEYLYYALDTIKKEGASFCIIEVSSIAAFQKKVSPLNFEYGVFTNLSPEHLDFHKTVDEYFAAKKAFIEKCKNPICNKDDKYGRLISGKISYSFSDAFNINSFGYDIMTGGEKIHIKKNITADFDIYNTLAAVKCCEKIGIPGSLISKGVESVKNIPGRIERITGDTSEFTVYVDFAHTPKAVEDVLCALGANRSGKLTALFGCGGDRDRDKRSAMGKAAEKYADRVIITSDNPRCENRYAIIKDIIKGLENPERAIIIPDRGDALSYALETAEKGEVIAVLGKGNERYEIDEKGMRHFNDKEEILKIIKRKFGK